MAQQDPVALKRSLSLLQLVLYGLGTTIGAGIYALVGKMAGIAGYHAPVSFLVASILAALTACSFAELSARFPRCAGAALYVKEGFSSERLSFVVGILVISAATVSAAALINAFTGYLGEFIELQRTTMIIVLALVLGAIAAWGISQSVTIAAAVTLIEIGGLLLLVVVSHSGIADLAERWQEMVPAFDSASWYGIFAASFLAFYAYTGFEDMVEVAEETRNVRRNLPLGIMLTLGITTLLYMAVMVTAVMAMPPGELAQSEAPLARLYEHYTGSNATIISLVALVAIINGALIQIIMVSRVLYGMSSRKLLPSMLSLVNRRTQTPLVATAFTTSMVLLLALAGDLASLAEAASLIILIVFSLANAALLLVKRKQPKPEGLIVFPVIVPLLGFVVSAGFVVARIVSLVAA